MQSTWQFRGIAAGMIAFIGLTVTGVVAPAGITPASATTLLFDKGSYTYDSSSNLDWLDLTATLNLSINDVFNNNGVSYVADGWHFATVEDLVGLYQDAGMTLDFDGTNYAAGYVGAAPDSRISGLIDFLGATGGGGSYTSAVGWLRDPATGDGGFGLLETFYDGTQWNSNAHVYNYAGGGDDSDSTVGSFLVRDHVGDVAVTPLPAALPMFAAATGLLGLAGWRRRRSRHQAASKTF